MQTRQTLRSMAANVKSVVITPKHTLLASVNTHGSARKGTHFHAVWKHSPKGHTELATTRVAARLIGRAQLYDNAYRVSAAAHSGIQKAAHYSPRRHTFSTKLPPGSENLNNRLSAS